MEHTAGAGGANEPPVLPKHTAFALARCEAFLCCSEAHLHPFSWRGLHVTGFLMVGFLRRLGLRWHGRFGNI